MGLWACLKLCGRLLWLSRVTFDVVDHLFVVVCGCGPHDVSYKLSYLLLGGDWMSEAVGVSSGCLGLPLML